MKNRLQFLHCNKLFSTAEEAKAFIERRVDLDKQHALYAEPFILKYGSEENPNILIGIGSVGDGVTAGNANNKFFYIDGAEIEKATKALTVITEDTNTVGMHSEAGEDGTTISADVKVPATRIVNGVVKSNTIQATEDGLFSLIDINYDQSQNALLLEINGETKVVNLPPSLVGGTYEYTGDDAEHIVLNLSDGTSIKVDVSKLIDEWDVEGEDSNTPIVLTKEHVVSSQSDHVQNWQDVLRADVRILPQEYMADNILKKDERGKYLYVKGTADNISMWKNGEKKTLQEVLSSMISEVSSLDGNIIKQKSDGIYAKAILSYNKANNTLSFDNGVEPVSFKLSGIDFIENIVYNSSTETIIITYKNSDGDIDTISIPAKDIIEEWDVDNSTSTVELTKVRDVSGKDKLSGNVKIANVPHNILGIDSQNHGLFVNGESNNISYNETSNVKSALDLLFSTESGISDQIAAVDNKVNTLSASTNDAIAEVRNDIDGISSEITSINEELAQQSQAIEGLEILVDETDTVTMAKTPYGNANKITSEVKLNANDNIIVKDANGLKANINFEYDDDTNTITVIKSNGEREEIKLTDRTAIESIEYDEDTECLVITYYTYSGGTRVPVTESIDLSKLIEEWVVDNTNKTVTLTRERVYENNPDKLSAMVNLSQENNAIKVVHENYLDCLFVKDLEPQLNALTETVSELGESVETAVSNVEALSGRVDALGDTLESDVARLEDEIESAKTMCSLNFNDTQTIDFTKNGNDVSASVILNSDSKNIIISDGNGMSANVEMEYIAAENKLRFKTSAMDSWQDMELAGVETVTNVGYDSINKKILLTFGLSSGTEKTIEIPVNDFMEPWDVDGGHDGAIKLEKETNSSGVEILSASVVVDNNPSNILTKTGEGTLLVDGTQIATNADNINSLSAVVEAISAASSGSSAALQFEVDEIERSAGLTSSGGYVPKATSSHLSGTTSLKDADEALDTAITRIETVINATGNTPTTTTYEKDDAMVSDVRLSGGLDGTSQADMTITSLRDIDGENALRIVAYDSEAHPDGASNGLFLSNIWDCGTF